MSQFLDTIVIGAGDAGTSPQNGTVRGAAGAGTNIAGSTLFIDAPTGTGSGAAGVVNLRAAPAGLSGTTAHALATVVQVAATGITETILNATTNAVDTVWTLQHNSSGTPAAGFGSAIACQLQDSTTTNQQAGRLRWSWNDATHASRKAQVTLSVNTLAGEVDLLAAGVSAGQVSTSSGSHEIVLGQGDGTSSIDAEVILRPASPKGASDVAGGILSIWGGTGTGAGAPGSIRLQVATATSSGTAIQSVVTAVQVSSSAVTVSVPLAGSSFTSTKAFANAVLASDASFNNNTTQADVTGLSFAIGANETWTAEFHLYATCSGTSAGFNLQLTGPSSPTTVRVSILGMFNSTTSTVMQYMTAFSSPTTTALCEFGTTGAPVIVRVTVVNGANAGTVQLQAAARAATNSTNTIVAGSYMTARRVA